MGAVRRRVRHGACAGPRLCTAAPGGRRGCTARRRVAAVVAQQGPGPDRRARGLCHCAARGRAGWRRGGAAGVGAVLARGSRWRGAADRLGAGGHAGLAGAGAGPAGRLEGGPAAAVRGSGLGRAAGQPGQFLHRPPAAMRPGRRAAGAARAGHQAARLRIVWTAGPCAPGGARARGAAGAGGIVAAMDGFAMNKTLPGPARCVMVLGTSSGAGKSWLATALCRYDANQGLEVAPFKAQNMSNNARVVAAPGGQFGEIGSAQYFQALAARATPDVRMNPLLLKPEADTHSQLVLLGQVSEALSQLPWRGRSQRVWPQIAAALDALRAENDVVVIEGAGSTTEINLMASDVVNMRVAWHADARCLLVADIDRGGAFAHLYGTWALLPELDRARLRGFVLNKFRGDADLLAPAPEQLHELTGVPTVATIPMLADHGLPEEDGFFFHPLPLGEGRGEGSGDRSDTYAQSIAGVPPPPPPPPRGGGVSIAK